MKARAIVGGWPGPSLQRSLVRAVGETADVWRVYRDVADRVAPRDNLVTDSHIVALMKLHGVREIWTHDRDFRKFDGIVVRDPFEVDRKR